MTKRRQGFIPPRRNEAVRTIVKLAVPVFLRRMHGVERVMITPEDLDRLEVLRGERVMIMPNHPTVVEPALMFHLACAAGMWFYTLAGRELFDEGWGLVGRIIQQCGTYSVVRGTADRESFRTTRQILAEPGAKLVVFPEGEVYTQNDSLLPFRTGVVQLAFWGQEDARKHAQPGPVYLLPVGVRYHFLCDMRDAIRASLLRCEQALDLTAGPEDGDYVRLRRIADACMRAMETVYGLPKLSDEDFTPRFQALRETILARSADAMGMRIPQDATLPDRTRALWNALYEVTQEPAEGASPYERRLLRERADRARPLLHDLNRVHNALAFYDGYVREDPTPERMVDTLRRVEFELFGKPCINGPRRARIRIGAPINLLDHFAAYQADKKGTSAAVTHQLEEAVGSLLRAPDTARGLSTTEPQRA